MEAASIRSRPQPVFTSSSALVVVKGDAPPGPPVRRQALTSPPGGKWRARDHKYGTVGSDADAAIVISISPDRSDHHPHRRGIRYPAGVPGGGAAPGVPLQRRRPIFSANLPVRPGRSVRRTQALCRARRGFMSPQTRVRSVCWAPIYSHRVGRLFASRRWIGGWTHENVIHGPLPRRHDTREVESLGDRHKR